MGRDMKLGRWMELEREMKMEKGYGDRGVRWR
jgi:hypothetical protein